MSIDILSMRKYQQDDRAFNVALPVLAVECEVTPPLDNYLDAYEETVLKFVSIGLAAHGIAVTLNATESLIEEVLDRLETKKYVDKEIGKPYKLTEAGEQYLKGEITERNSDNSQFGYVFVNAIKKEVLPFFYQGDINQIALFKGASLPARLTVEGDETRTFEDFPIKRAKLRDAYRKYLKNSDASRQLEDGKITKEEAIDLFEDLESFEEEEEISETLADVEKQATLNSNMFIRALNCPIKHVYLTMRIILDPSYPGGYRAESPFDFDGMDNNYFLRQIQWLAATGNTYLNGEEFDSFLTREIRKISPEFGNSEVDFSVFVMEKMPLLKQMKNRFSLVYDDMSRIYSLMQREHSLIDKENIVNNISRYVVESLFNDFFRGIKQDTLNNIQNQALDDLEYYHGKQFKIHMLQGTALNPDNLYWNDGYTEAIINRLPKTHGNSIVEKFINIILLNYYLGTNQAKKFLSKKDIQDLYDLAEKLNKIRRKVSHDTDDRFETKDYEFYIANVFDLVNGILDVYREVL